MEDQSSHEVLKCIKGNWTSLFGNTYTQYKCLSASLNLNGSLIPTTAQIYLIPILLSLLYQTITYWGIALNEIANAYYFC